MRNSVVLAVVLLLVASACTSSSNETPNTTTPAVAAPQSEAFWCDVFSNHADIAKTAIQLQVDGYEPLEVEQERILDKLGAPFLDNFLAGFLELEWKDDNESGFAQACAAAYESR